MTSLNFRSLFAYMCVGTMMVTLAISAELIQDGYQIIDEPIDPECIYVCSDEEPDDEYSSHIWNK